MKSLKLGFNFENYWETKQILKCITQKRIIFTVTEKCSTIKGNVPPNFQYVYDDNIRILEMLKLLVFFLKKAFLIYFKISTHRFQFYVHYISALETFGCNGLVAMHWLVEEWN